MPQDEIESRFVKKHFDKYDRIITGWLARYGLTFLRIALGIVFIWFGLLKFFPEISPADQLIRKTIYFFDPDLFIPVLAAWETLIGLGLISGKFMRFTLLLLFLQMPGTVLPLVILPEATWSIFPVGLTLEGQYIVKNLVLIAAGFVLGATVRGGRIEPQPDNTDQTPL